MIRESTTRRELQACEDTVLCEQEDDEYFMQEFRNVHNELYLQNQQIRHTFVKHRRSHFHRYYFLHRLHFHLREEREDISLNVATIEEVVQDTRFSRFRRNCH